MSAGAAKPTAADFLLELCRKGPDPALGNHHRVGIELVGPDGAPTRYVMLDSGGNSVVRTPEELRALGVGAPERIFTHRAVIPDLAGEDSDENLMLVFVEFRAYWDAHCDETDYAELPRPVPGAQGVEDKAAPEV